MPLPISDAQANAEAVARRDSRYAGEHLASRARFSPTGFGPMLAMFVSAWEAEYKMRMHATGIEAEPPGRIVRADGSGVTDPGGGNALGSPAFDGETRARIFGSPRRRDADGNLAEPMHDAVDRLRVELRRPLMAALLSAIGRGASWADAARVVCPDCNTAIPLPSEYARAVTRDALRVVIRQHDEAPGGPSATA